MTNISETHISDQDDEAPVSTEPSEFAKLFNASTLAPRRKLRMGEKVKGEVLLVGREEIFVALGAQREGILPRLDALDAEGNVPFKTGDMIEVFVARLRGDDVLLSLKAGRAPSLDRNERNRGREEASASRAQGARAFLADHPVGSIISGTVRKLEAFGAFIELTPGLEGLAHISELAWTRIGDPKEVLEVGQKVDVKILKIESVEGKTRVALSVRQTTGQPWEKIAQEFSVGSVIEGKVTRCEKFGAFVEIIPGVEGLIPLSEMSYTKRILRSDELCTPGEKITVKIKSIDAEQRRMSLSLKDAGEDPWALAESKFAPGTLITGKVDRRESYGLFVRLQEGVTGLLPKSKTLDTPSFSFERIKIGDEIAVQVAEIARDQRRISLMLPGDPNVGNWKEYSAEQAAAPKPQGGGFSSGFADLLKKATTKKK